MATDSRLASWVERESKQQIVNFLAAADDLPREKKVAVFDNDGTLWCEKPVYPQLLFMVGELHRAIQDDPSLGDRPEYRALLDEDQSAQAQLGLPAIAFALVELCAGIGPDEFDQRVLGFFESARHPDRDVPLRQMRYQPMLELIDELRAHDFSVFIVTGGGTEFVRTISHDFYGVAPERVVGSLIRYDVARDGNNRPILVRTKELFGEVDEGAAKVSNMQIGLGRRPIFAAGNSPGDTEMLDYTLTADGPTMALLVNHDDPEREYAYEGRAESFDTQGSFVESGHERGWNVVSMRDDWNSIFAPRA